MSVARSGNGFAALVAIATLAGCATTQQEASRLQLNSARIRATELRVRVRHPNREIRVTAVAALAAGRGTAILVRLHSVSRRILTDLPISVGEIGPHGRVRYLNGAVGSDYFGAHVAAIAPGATVSWVFTSPSTIAPRTHLFARVGTSEAGFSNARTLPVISVSVLGPVTRGAVSLAVRNRSAVPQYELQVYGTVSGSHGYLAAGRATVAHLGSGATQTLRMRLLGNPAHAAPVLQAPPTIFG